MAIKNIKAKFVLRNDTTVNWETKNPVLMLGEIGINTDLRQFKIGDGITAWNDLSYSGADGAAIQELIDENKDNLFQYTRTDAAQSDTDAIAAAVGDNEIAQGDIVVITTVIGEKTYEQSAFMFDGTQWGAMTGHVDADKVIMREDITMAGNYDKVGNLTKTMSGTATFATKGKSVAEAFTEIFSKKLQPTITASPAVSLTFGQAKAYEVGTTVNPTYSASLSAGSYTYGPATGITAQSWEISDTDGNTATTASGSFDPIVVADGTNYKITAKATYGDGTVAYDNLGGLSSPEVKITGGTATKTSGAVTGYRSYFYGVLDTSSAEAPLTSAIVRSMTNSNGAYSGSKTFTINATSTAKRIVVAIPHNAINGSRVGVKEVILTSAMNTPVTDSYVKTASAVEVTGAGSSSAVSYDVWVYEPAAIDAGEVHKITLG